MQPAYFQQYPLDTIPDLLALHIAHPARYPHLLTSSAQGNELARYHILFACPQQTLSFDPEQSFLHQLDTNWEKEKTAFTGISLPFKGGWFLYLSYELAAEVEPGLELPVADNTLPVAFATRFPAAVIIDKLQQQAYIVCEHEYPEQLEQVRTDIAQLSITAAAYQQPVSIEPLVEDDEADYLRQFDQLKQYIMDGDVFQVNLSRAWQTTLNTPVQHASLFWHLSQNNPGPFNALLTLGEQAIISSSPERLVEVSDRQVQTRPIAGTRPRSANAADDQALLDELIAHPKERAEHIMLIDLERNDLGRICKPGTVKVDELMALESYQHVHHIVSNVSGELTEGITPGQVIRAVFPGGTITGCPKVRCMEILAELEQAARGPYTGSLGYLNRDGSMDLNILIRTIVRDKNKLWFRAGGGVVADSDPVHELNETRAKARGMVMALTGSK
ncbi:MAG: aminodeoxychorismate synthase component I [Gammaproteobacteria bacterium]|nr:aminodeoxychorismate synthase component I [Gammaproteobacteria bacterium]